MDKNFLNVNIINLAKVDNLLFFSLFLNPSLSLFYDWKSYLKPIVRAGSLKSGEEMDV